MFVPDLHRNKANGLHTLEIEKLSDERGFLLEPGVSKSLPIMG